MTDDNSEIDIAEVNSILAKLAVQRASGAFKEADRLKVELLLDHGVIVDDTKRQWRGGGHGYVRAEGDDTEAVDRDTIDGLLSERERAWLQRQQSIDLELLLDHGVALNNASRRWRGGATVYDWFRPYSSLDARKSDDPDFMELLEKKLEGCTRDPDDTSSNFDEALVTRLVARCVECLKRGYFQEAGQLKVQLLEMGVVLDSKKRQWRGGYEPGHSIKREQGDQEPVDLEKVNAAFKELEFAFHLKNMDRMNAILAQLFTDFGITVDTNQEKWRVGFSSTHSFRPDPANPSDHEVEDMEGVDRLLCQLEYFLRIQFREQSSTVSAQLLKDHGVVSPSYRQWHLVDHDNHGCIRSPDDTSTVDLLVVNALLTRYIECMRRNYFEESRSLEHRLMKEHGVAIDTKERTWKGGMGPGYGSFMSAIVEGNGSISSKSTDVIQQHGYACSDDDLETVKKDIGRINTLLEVHRNAMQERNWTAIGQAAVTLVDEFDITVDPVIKRWRVGFPSGKRVVLDGNDGGTEPQVDVDAVNALIKKRIVSRYCGHFVEADSILAKLLDVHGVLVDDKSKQWCSGFTEVPMYSRRNNQDGIGGARKGDNHEHHPAIPKDGVIGLLRKLSKARIFGRTDNAANLELELRESHNIHLDHEEHTWWQTEATV